VQEQLISVVDRIDERRQSDGGRVDIRRAETRVVGIESTTTTAVWTDDDDDDDNIIVDADTTVVAAHGWIIVRCACLLLSCSLHFWIQISVLL
jgi:hypothetical protein